MTSLLKTVDEPGGDVLSPYTVLIPARNERSHIERTLQLVCRQIRSWPAGGEIILIDSASTDGTGSLALKVLESFYPDIKASVLYLSEPGKGRALRA